MFYSHQISTFSHIYIHASKTYVPLTFPPFFSKKKIDVWNLLLLFESTNRHLRTDIHRLDYEQIDLNRVFLSRPHRMDHNRRLNRNRFDFTSTVCSSCARRRTIIHNIGVHC